jgi:hypothetical protein
MKLRKVVNDESKKGVTWFLRGAPRAPKHLLEMLLRLEMDVKILLFYSRVIARPQ